MSEAVTASAAGGLGVCTHPWRYRVAPFRIFGGLYFVGTRAVSIHLVDTGDGLVLIDAGFPQTLYLLLESVRELGFDPRSIRYILCTHAHYDHVGGVRALAELTGAEVCVGAADADTVEGRPELTEAELHGMQFHETFVPSRRLVVGDVVRCGDVAVTCIHAPGHTAGTMAYFFEVASDGGRFRAGIHGGPGTATLRDDYLCRHGLPLELREAYLRSLSRLREEHVDIHLGAHPGQSRTFAKRDRLSDDPQAFVNPGDWTQYLAELEKRYTRAFPVDRADA